MKAGSRDGSVQYRIKYIEPLYGFAADIRHISVGESSKAQRTLVKMGQLLPGTADLVGIYIPEMTEDPYRPGKQKGRIVGAVRLVPMPVESSIQDYHYHDVVDGSLRWPIGWPCETVYAPPTDQCPYLRTLVDDLFGRGAFAPYVKRFQQGPFKLEPRMVEALTTLFSRFPPLR